MCQSLADCITWCEPAKQIIITKEASYRIKVCWNSLRTLYTYGYIKPDAKGTFIIKAETIVNQIALLKYVVIIG
jgi:hypothetical protein